MSRRADILVAQTTGVLQSSGGGTEYIVQTPAGVLYLIYVDTGSDLAFKKSLDGGQSWSAATVILTGTIVSLAVWYDRWSSIAAGLIHLAYTDGADGDTKYRTINTESSDALSTQTIPFAGSSSAAGGHLSITRAKGGNVYIKTVIDAGAEGGFYRLPNANVPAGAWDAARTVDETIATQDMMMLAPNLTAADTQDIMAVFWDTSANELSRKLYDDSANSWAEASIATSMTKPTQATAFPCAAIAVDLTNSRIFLVAWSAVDSANADLRCWYITDSAITEVTNVVLNSTDDQGLCAISIDSITGALTVFYAGKSDGSETWPTSMNVYVKGSTDTGSTWGAETKMTWEAADTEWMVTCPWVYRGPAPVAFHKNRTLDEVYINVDPTDPKAVSIAGVM
jgi:hypothetical protein